ncbi:MAG: hypothetical protein JF595_06435 [Sphingomonadales bacterium]|nr:hypothetical protein [Sphingomonadales bacterium]
MISIPAIRQRLETDYHDRLSAHAAALPELTGLDPRICEGLRQDGIFVTSLEALGMPASAEMFETARRMAADYAPEAHRRAGAGEKYLMFPSAKVMMQPVLFTWGFADRLLNIAESYLGLPPAYDGMALVYSVADGMEEATRRWHRDREDRRMVRICIYLNHVDADGGPFELDRRGREALQPDDPDAVRGCTGPAGTVIFADTARCLHRGRPAARDRMAIFYSYFSRRPRNSFYCERSGLSRAQISALARELPARQVESALWHRRLPHLLRVIPSAPI